MADFQFYLNRQGIRGLQGVKGDQGDSPIITVQAETPNEYVLKITNPDGTELISPNLRGNKININEGTYVRYNTDTGELYTSTADGATGELAGVVRLATDADITNMDERTAVTPSQLADALSQYLVSPNGSVKIVQNADTSLTELTVTGGLTDVPIASADTLGVVKIGENLSITEDGTLSANDSNYIKTSQVSTGGLDYGVYLNSANGNKLDTIQPKFNTLDGALETLSIQYLNPATYSASEPADEDMVNNWTDKDGYLTGLTSSTGFISGSVRFNAGSGSSQVVFKLMEAGLISGIDQKGGSKFSKIEISTDGTTYTEYNNFPSRAKYIRFTFDYNFTDIAIANFSTRIKIITSNIASGSTKALAVKVDNSTIQIVDDKLHANFDGINKEIDDVSSKVTTLEGQVENISTTLDSNTTDIENLKKTKNDNIFDISKFTVVGSPTITDDGVASGFSDRNKIKFDLNNVTGKNVVFDFTFSTPDLSKMSNPETDILALKDYDFLIKILKSDKFLAIAYNDNIKTETVISFPTAIKSNTQYRIVYSANNYSHSAKLYETGLLVGNLSNTSTVIHPLNGTYSVGARGTIGYAKFDGSIDLKQFSITVDGKEVFNGLMNSTKPIYDAIKTNKTELSEFKTETSTDFSAVNSALNEKANLTDLALKQNTLVSGTNIKTINGQSILGKGNITVGDGGVGATIDDSTTTTTSVWSSSKTNTEITTAVDTINSTKNDNIFDISKFTVVGSPTITDDGVASGFSRSNYIITPAFDFSKPFTILAPFKLNTIQQNKCIFQIAGADGWWNYVVISSQYASCILQFSDKTTKTLSMNLSKEYSLNETYYLQLNFTGQEYGFKLLDKDKKILQQTSYETTLKLYNSTNKVVNLGYTTNGSGYNLSNGSIDLKQFSITVDGKEVFNGLMNSTKPIYDKITTLNTNLSNFELETSNDFSAVNSALNEKANLSDLSKCASLADFNRLSDTVTALANQVRDISAALNNINGR